MAQTASEMKELSDQVLRIRDDLVAKAPKQAGELLEVRDRINDLVDRFEQPKPTNHKKSTTPVKTSLGKKISQARNERGMSQSELAETTGISLVSLRKIESGETKRPQGQTKAKLASTLGINLP